MDFWSSIKPRLHLLNVPLFAVTVAAVIVAWLLVGQPIPMTLLFPIAVVINPALWFALALYARISAYERALRDVDHSKDHLPGTDERDAYNRFKRMYRLRERLARRWLTRDGVYLGHFLKHLQLSHSVSRDPMNAHASLLEEERALRESIQRRRLDYICRFVYAAPAPSPAERKKALLDFLETLPKDGGRVSEIIKATRDDGDGIFSTLTALTHTHYVLGLPAPSVREILGALNLLDFDPSTYGWLSHRVLEAAVQLHIRDGSDRAKLVESLQPILTDTTLTLAAADSDDAKRRSKWRARDALRSELGVT